MNWDLYMLSITPGSLSSLPPQPRPGVSNISPSKRIYIVFLLYCMYFSIQNKYKTSRSHSSLLNSWDEHMLRNLLLSTSTFLLLFLPRALIHLAAHFPTAPAPSTISSKLDQLLVGWRAGWAEQAQAERREKNKDAASPPTCMIPATCAESFPRRWICCSCTGLQSESEKGRRGRGEESERMSHGGEIEEIREWRREKESEKEREESEKEREE
eukprot:728724-Hanusia_phi.AAC.1